jgi:hypothetical protein
LLGHHLDLVADGARSNGFNADLSTPALLIKLVAAAIAVDSELGTRQWRNLRR